MYISLTLFGLNSGVGGRLIPNLINFFIGDGHDNAHSLLSIIFMVNFNYLIVFQIYVQFSKSFVDGWIDSTDGQNWGYVEEGKS